LIQGESQEGDLIVEKDGWTFAVEKEIADVVIYVLNIPIGVTITSISSS